LKYEGTPHPYAGLSSSCPEHSSKGAFSISHAALFGLDAGGAVRIATSGPERCPRSVCVGVNSAPIDEPACSGAHGRQSRPSASLIAGIWGGL